MRWRRRGGGRRWFPGEGRGLGMLPGRTSSLLLLLIYLLYDAAANYDWIAQSNATIDAEKKNNSDWFASCVVKQKIEDPDWMTMIDDAMMSAKDF